MEFNMQYKKELIRDINELWPFYGVEIPRSMKCVDAVPSDEGIRSYRTGQDDQDYPFWDSVTFESDFLRVKFTARGRPLFTIKIEEMVFEEYPEIPSDFKQIQKELDFVRGICAL